jgi:hypothetical protein
MKTVYFCLLLLVTPLFSQDVQPVGLRITIIDGEGALNNVKGRVAREPIVQVQDEHHNLVPGAVVTFTLPQQGAGAAFANGAHTLTVTTDTFGRAAAYGMQPNKLTGSFRIHVTASHNGQIAHAVISQTNIAGAAAANVAGAVTAAKVGGLSVKAIVAIIAVGAGAAAGGTYFALHNSSGPPAVGISAGAGTVAPVH